jgi:hypothetical protein
VSPKVRLLALVGLVAAFALGGGLLLLSKQSSSSAATPKIHPLYPHKRHHARAGVRLVKKAAHKPVRKATHPSQKPRRKHVLPRPAVVDGMPRALALALRNNQVVVVSLYTPRSSVDQLALAEARAGAAAAGAGFVGLNVVNERDSHAFTRFLATVPNADDRLLDDPAVLVFQQPKSLFVRLNGFADRDTVAQAAQNALLSAVAAAAVTG